MITKAVTIPAGASISDDAGDVTGLRLVGIHMPDAWTTAAVTFSVSLDNGGRFGPLVARNDSAEMVFSAGIATPDAFLVPSPLSAPNPFVGHLKVRSGMMSGPVNQTDTRTLVLYFTE